MIANIKSVTTSIVTWYTAAGVVINEAAQEVNAIPDNAGYLGIALAILAIIRRVTPVARDEFGFVAKD